MNWLISILCTLNILTPVILGIIVLVYVQIRSTQGVESRWTVRRGPVTGIAGSLVGFWAAAFAWDILELPAKDSLGYVETLWANVCCLFLVVVAVVGPFAGFLGSTLVSAYFNRAGAAEEEMYLGFGGFLLAAVLAVSSYVLLRLSMYYGPN